MIKFSLLPPYRFSDDVLPFKEYESKESDIVEAYKEVRNFIWNNGVGYGKAHLIRLSHAINGNDFILIDDIMEEIKKRGLVRGVDYI